MGQLSHSLPVPFRLTLVAVIGLIVAGLLWYLIGYHVARTLNLGFILLPASGAAAAGASLAFIRSTGKTGLITLVVAVIVGGIAGDIAWTAAFTQKSLGTLLGPELQATLNTSLTLTKALLYGISAYLAWIIAAGQANQPISATSNAEPGRPRPDSHEV